MADTDHLIIDPRSGDRHRVEDMCEELMALLRKHDYALVHKPHAILLAKVEMEKMQLRVLAELREIDGTHYDYKLIDWRKRGNE